MEKRKPARLQGYDYSQNGAYFLTLCAKGKTNLFGHVVGAGVLDGPRTALSPLGEFVRDRLEEMNRVYSDMHISNYIIMPNHVHLLLVLEQEKGPSRTPAPTKAQSLSGAHSPTNARVPAFVSTLKRMTNRAAGQNLWQRSFHDHVIRSEADYLDHWSYIDGNPAKWTEDEYYTE